MSRAEELLDSLTEEQIMMYGVNPVDELHIVIESDKTITIPDDLRHIAVQGEHNIETVTFDCPRYWDGHDLSQMQMRIVYQRPDGHREPHLVENLRVGEADENTIHFDWTISGNVTAVKGNISFMVCAKLSDSEGNREREWHTRLNQDLVVDEGMECSGEEIVEQNPDIIEAILVQLDELKNTGGVSDEQVANAVAAYMTEHPVESGSDHVIYIAQDNPPDDTSVLWIDTDDDNSATGSNSGQSVDQAVYVLALSEDETDAQANSDAITAAITEHKNVMLKFGRYPVVPGIVVESGALNLNGSELYAVQYKYSGGLVILSGENPVIYGGALAGTYDLADNEDGYVFHESEKLIVPEGVNNAVIRDMELHNCWGYAISGTDGIVERVYVDTAPSTTQNNFYCVTDKIPIPDNCKYVTAAGGSGYNYIISYRDVIYNFVDVDGKSLGRRTGVPRVRIPIPDGAVSVTIHTFTLTHEVIPYYAYFTNYTETLTVEDCVIRHCHSLAMANMCGPTTVSRCRFVGMGKPRPGAAGTTRGTTGGIDIEDIQTPELIMSDCHSEDCMNLLLFGGYNATVSNCTGAVIRSYRGWRLQLDNCNTSYLDIDGSCPVQISNTYAEILKIEESAYRYVSGDIATSRMYKALGAFDHYFVDRKDATASVDEHPTVPLHGTTLDRTYRAAPSGVFAKGSKVSLLCYPHDNQKAYYGAGGVRGDSYGITANAPMYPNGYTISDSMFNIADSRGIYDLTTKSLSGTFKNCVFNLTGGNYFNKFMDKQDAPCHLVFDGCTINNADYRLFNVALYAGSVLEFRGCAIANPDKIIAKTEGITIQYVDPSAPPSEIVLASSTEGSVKQFRVTVGDDGTLTAVEVTN